MRRDTASAKATARRVAISPWVTHPSLESDSDIVHGTTTRLFAEADVKRTELLARIRQEFGMPDAISVALDQVHGKRVAWIDRSMTSKAKEQVLQVGESDAAATRLPNVLIHISTADCVPIIAFDRRSRIIGAAHAGWKGTVKKIAHALITRMKNAGATLEHTQVWIGPHIGQCCFEVGEEVLEKFTGVSRWWPAIDLRKRCVDLAMINRLTLARAGIPPDNMFTSSLCTRCNADRLHSHRADPEGAGRMQTVIGMRR